MLFFWEKTNNKTGQCYWDSHIYKFHQRAVLLSKENCDFLLLQIINSSLFTYISIALRVFTMKTTAIALLISIVCILVEPQNILYLTSPSIQFVIKRSSSLWPLALSLLHLLVLVTYCEPSVLIRSGSSSPSGSVSFMQVDKGTVIEAKRFLLLFPVEVLWALSIWTLWFNLQCLTPSVICSGILCDEFNTISMEKMR